MRRMKAESHCAPRCHLNNKRRAVTAQTARCRSNVGLLSIRTFIILGPTKGSGREDKSFAEKSGN